MSAVRWAAADWAAVGCAAAAVWSALGPPAAVLRLSAHRPSGPPPRLPPAARAVTRALAGAASLARARAEHRRRAERWRTAVISLCDGVAAELRAGRTPEDALARALAVIDPEVACVLHIGGADVPVLLERAAHEPGGEGLRLLAACWRIGAERGGTLASVVDGLADTLRHDRALRQEVAAQLAGPRATARLLGGLPLLGLAMATALGARPVAFLLGSAPGAVCLVAGVGLDLIGLWWTRRLTGRAETPLDPRGRSDAWRAKTASTRAESPC